MVEVSAPEARHHIANLLHEYTASADRKDVEAAVALLHDTEVSFPWGGFSTPEGGRQFLSSLWSTPVRQRHDVSNLVVTTGDRPGQWCASAHFTRWVLDPDPVVDTLGDYSLTVDEHRWHIASLRITRAWGRTSGPHQ